MSGAAPAAQPAPPQPTRPAPRTIVPQVVLDGVGPLAWNAAASQGRASGGATPSWSAVRVLGSQGAESLFVFPARARAPTLLASWPRQEAAAHLVRIFPGYRWVVVETAADPEFAAQANIAVTTTEPRRARFYSPAGSLAWDTRAGIVPAALGRDFVLAAVPSSADSVPPRVSVVRLPGGNARATWPAVAGWGASSPLENFLAVNTIGVVDSVSGSRQDEIRLLDLEGTILWARAATADPHEFAVSNFGDVAIARDRELVVFDRSGAEKLRMAMPRNSVGRTAITPDGRFVLLAASSPLGKRAGAGLWVALYDIAHKTVLWSRRNLAPETARVAEALELSLSDDGQRALVRLTTGAVVLLGNGGRTLVSWNLERVSRGECAPGLVPRRTWLSGDGTSVAFTMPVARSLADARGWLYRVPR